MSEFGELRDGSGNFICLTKVPSSDIPRRNDMRRWIPAEKAIHDAVQAVEEVGAHPLLTDAVVLLGQAKDKLGDYVDSVGETEALRAEIRRLNDILAAEQARSNELREGLADALAQRR